MNEFINKDILDYVELNSQQEPTLLKELNKETHLKILNPRMLCSSYQGRVLSIISKIIKPKKGLFQLNFRELWDYRDLIYLFVRRDFVSKYKQTILGPLWFIIQPLLTTLMFVVVFVLVF